MSGLVDGILGQLGPAGMAQIAKSLGADEGAVGSAVGAALPAIIAGMANNARQPSGAESLANALNDHSPSIFDSLGGLLGGGGAADGAKILGHVLGGRQPSVAENLAGQSGLDVGMIMKLLPILAPLVMGYLSKQKQEQGLDAGGLGAVLGQERKQVEAQKPGLGGLASILDADGDGSIVDDILGKLTGN
ncbi:MAG: DUF937 domain-containing protein [Acidimicrobiales bacterium]